MCFHCYFVSVPIAVVFCQNRKYFSCPRLSQVLDSIYFSRRFHVRCVAQARDKAGHLGTPLRSNIVTIGTEGSICHTPVTTGTARGFQAQSFVATLKYLDVKHKQHPNRWVGGVSTPPTFLTTTSVVLC